MFHLPWDDHNGTLSEKVGWNRGHKEWELFEIEIFNRLRKARPRVRATPGATGDSSPADFRRVTFPITFDFRQFKGALYVNFDGASFCGIDGFCNAIFGDAASFKRATFREGVSFDRAYFEDDVCFEHATFMDVAFFDGARFGDGVRFSDAVFNASALFDDTKFGNDAHFVNATFHQKVVFAAPNAKDSVFDFQRIFFSGAKFKGGVSFENRQFEATSSFDGAIFENLPYFHGCKFHQGTSFHETAFLKTKGGNNKATAALEQAYRTLKLAMETLRARNEEATFFALEMECRRNRSDVPPIERFAATLYKNLSDYGRAVDLPLLWLLALANISFLVFGIVALATDTPDSVHLVSFTFEQMFRPFYVWSMSPVGTAPELVTRNPMLIPLLASLQSLATLSLLALFLLALRRRFKMD